MKDESRIQKRVKDAAENERDVLISFRVAEEAAEDLRQRTKQFSLRLTNLFGALPASATAAQVIGKQVLRSGTSVGANYREACRARSDQEFVAKLGDGLKELDETVYWLELLAESGIWPAAKLNGLIKETDELLAIFTTISKAVKKKLRYSH